MEMDIQPSCSNANNKRTKNFTEMEETILLNLVRDHAKILENKKTDSGANHKKAQCWVQIEKAFNCQSGGTYRNISVLKKKYENIKKKTKRKMADEKCYKLGTGGGPNMKTEINTIDNTILEILGSVRVEGLPSEFGGDAVLVPEEKDHLPQDVDEFVFDFGENNNTMHDSPMEDQSHQKSVDNIEIYSEESSKNENIREETNKVQWAKYTPEMLKKKKAKALTRAKNNNENRISTEISQWASVKAALEEEKKKLLTEEYKTKIQLLRERQQAEIDILKKESDFKIAKMKEEKEIIIECLKEEHRLKKEILELQKIQLLKDLRT